MSDSAGNYGTHLKVFGALLAIWGILGWIDVGNLAQGGWAEDGNNTVTQVLPGSPSEAAGLRVGDHILSVGGIARTDAGAAARRGRPDVGETWEFVVERDGATTSVPVTFGELVPERKLLAHANQVLGFCFLGFTLWAFVQRQSAATLTLAITGTLLSAGFFGGHYFENYSARSISNALTTILVFLGVPALLHFLLVFPTRSAFLERGNAKLILYGPGLAVGLFIAYRILATPEATSAMNNFTTIFVGVVLAVYLISCIVTAYKSYSGASAEERADQGLNLMLVGTVAGFALPLITTVLGIFSPQLVLPGQNFYFLTFALIPITWSMAALKGGGAAQEASA
jgi:hypothetical protein